MGMYLGAPVDFVTLLDGFTARACEIDAGRGKLSALIRYRIRNGTGIFEDEASPWLP
jgi:hypothetical protein